MLRNRGIVLFASGAMALAWLAFTSFAVSAEEQAAPAQAATAPAAAPAPAAEPALPDMALGKADAPVTIVEYSSLSCPHCAVSQAR